MAGREIKNAKHLVRLFLPPPPFAMTVLYDANSQATPIHRGAQGDGEHE